MLFSDRACLIFRTTKATLLFFPKGETPIAPDYNLFLMPVGICFPTLSLRTPHVFVFSPCRIPS